MIKRIICVILVLLMLPVSTVFAKFDSQAAADKIWDYLMEQLNDEKIAAAIMGYYQRESGFKSDSIHNWYLYKEDIGPTFTKELKELDLEHFIVKVQAAGGYGLGAWYGVHHLKGFYNYFNDNGYEYDDVKAQCDFTIKGIKDIPELFEKLQNAKDARAAGLLIGYIYDGADQTGAEVISWYSKVIYDERSSK